MSETLDESLLTGTQIEWGESGFSMLPPPAHRYHVFQRLKLLGDRFDPVDPYWTEIITLREFLAAADHYNVEQEVAQSLRLGQEQYVKAVRDGLFQRMLSWLKLYDQVDLEKEPGNAKRPFGTADPLIVGELHCPAVDGAKAAFETTSTHKSKVGLEVTAAGVGGGGWSRERVYASGSKLTVKAPECALLRAYLSGHYVIWRHVDRSDDLLVLVNVTGIDKLFASPLSEHETYAEVHLCDKPETFGRFVKEIDAGMLVSRQDYVQFETPMATGEHIDTAEWETTREYSGHWGVDAQYKGQKLGGAVTFTSTFTEVIKVEVTCPPGYHYVGRFRSARELPQQWAAAPLAVDPGRRARRDSQGQ